MLPMQIRHMGADAALVKVVLLLYLKPTVRSKCSTDMDASGFLDIVQQHRVLV